MIQSIDGIISPNIHQLCNIFALDLNCAIYKCVKDMPSIEECGSKINWEKILVLKVIDYISLMSEIVLPTEILYIAVDGVVPMAKIKQQRLRRFKSSIDSSKSFWDTNAITPGTHFMSLLTTELYEFSKSKLSNGALIIVSPADIPGEGEQKIMSWLRSYPLSSKRKNIVIYGLDADLILLSMLHVNNASVNLWLFRENQELGGDYTKEGVITSEFLYMNINLLIVNIIDLYFSKYNTPHVVNDFVALMNLIGNDFIPHNMSIKIKNGGIETLVKIYSELKLPLTNSNSRGNLTYNANTLYKLMIALAYKESDCVESTIIKKLTSRIINENDIPVSWAAESILINSYRIKGKRSIQYQLKSDWMNIYNKTLFGDTDISIVVDSYIKMLCWTLSYYTGCEVRNDVYYPWALAPLFTDIIANWNSDLLIPETVIDNIIISPIQHLASVLPKLSFELLPEKLHELPTKYKDAWPDKWETFSLGKRFLWECEPIIPLITPAQIIEWTKDIL